MVAYRSVRCGVLFFVLIAISFIAPGADAQPLKKVRLASSSTNVSFLALYTAVHRGFFKDEGLDLEIIFMPANLASTAGKLSPALVPGAMKPISGRTVFTTLPVPTA